MGNSSNSKDDLEMGEGYRILQVSENSPFMGKVQHFFDFIIEVIPQQGEKSPTDILDKLSPSPTLKVIKPPIQILNENIGKVIDIKIVSTKYRKVRRISVNLNSNVAGNSDIVGLSLRKERFDEVFDTYFPVTDIQNNSPVKKAGLREGQYLIGCMEFGYRTIDGFMEGLYERFFDKEIQNKGIHLVVYDIATDYLTLKEVVLKRGWGGKGLLGCQFSQGLLNKFPHNLEEQRKELRQKENQRKEIERFRNELGDCDGASKSLIEALQNQKSKKGKHFKNIRNLLNIQPPNLAALSVPKEEPKRMIEQSQNQGVEVSNLEQAKRIEELQNRVGKLEQTLYSVKQYLTKMQLSEESINQSL